MATVDESSQAVADVYARALLELALAKGEDERIGEELDELVGLAQRDPDFRVFMTSEAVDRDRRAMSLEKLFRGKLADVLLDTLQVMNEKDRGALLSALRARYIHCRYEHLNQVEAAVTTATPLDDVNRQALVAELAQMTGKQIVLHEAVDESVLGGLIVQIGDRCYDGSMATHLRRLRGEMLERSSRELHGDKDFVLPT